MKQIKIAIAAALLLAVCSHANREYYPNEVEIGYIPWSRIYRVEPKFGDLPLLASKKVKTVDDNIMKSIIQEIDRQKGISQKSDRYRMYMVFSFIYEKEDTLYLSMDCSHILQKKTKIRQPSPGTLTKTSMYMAYPITFTLIEKIREVLPKESAKEIFLSKGCKEIKPMERIDGAKAVSEKGSQGKY